MNNLQSQNEELPDDEIPPEVKALADVIAEGYLKGIRVGPYSLARYLLQSGYASRADIASIDKELLEHGDKMAEELTKMHREIKTLRTVLAGRERELLELKGPCSNVLCSLHYAHSGICDVDIGGTRDGTS